MRGFVSIVVASALLLVGAAPVAADSAPLPGGTTLSVDITSPATGAIVPAGATTVTGTASVGEAPAVKDTTVVYALDVSGSTATTSGVNCDGVGGNDTILQCEKASIAQVNAEAAATRSPVANSGVAAFSATAAALDVDPVTPGPQLLTAPGPNIDAAVAPLTVAGGTSFVAGLNAANTILNSSGAQPTKTLVFLSDGLDTIGGVLPAASSGTVVLAFAIGGATCATGGALSLNAVAAKGAVGSACTQVTNLAVLDDVIGEQIGSTLDALAISVDFGAPIPIPNTAITPALPQSGPATVGFTTSVTLASGPHLVCVQATGSDVGGIGTAADCVIVQVATSVVDCTVTCEAVANDGNVAVAKLNARNLPKTVGLRAAPTPPNGCGGVACVTGFDALFNGVATDGRAALRVRTAPEFSTPFYQAAVYMDGVKVTRSCISNIWDKPEQLPCKIILPDLRGGTIYFVKFNADPGFRFR